MATGDGIDWPGLYRWSLQYSDGTSPQCRLSEDDIAFLQAAMRDAMQKTEDPNQVAQQQVSVIQRFLKHQASSKDCIAALSVVQRLVDDYPQLSKDLRKLQALSPLLQLVGLYTASPAGDNASCAGPPPSEVVSRHLGEADAAQAFIILEKTLEILATAVQNNPEAQQAVADLNGLRVLFELVRENPKSKALRVRALQTLACLLRHHRPSEMLFLSSRGLALLVYAMNQDDPKYQEKACSLTRHFLLESLVPFESAKESGFFQALERLLPQIRDIQNVQFEEIVMQLAITTLQQYRVSMAREGILPTFVEALRRRREALESARLSLQSEASYLNSKQAMQVLTAQEGERLEGISFDLQTVEEQCGFLNEALQIAEVQKLLPQLRQQQQHNHQQQQQQHNHHQQQQQHNHHQQQPSLPSLQLPPQEEAAGEAVSSTENASHSHSSRHHGRHRGGRGRRS